ncbi:uncharacterized protein LOC129179208 isoform X4 [Dunckerocampus dactyliophorus]|uniref:uncharacterized protein LOC129179208 isoform X4 n=1 Tax=Dunckerocampus dactyliophorus TaxID=161453 RepID=UPI0024075DD6|nr:uncharacterized protein LOC129179208 isoform X4 [Dunckerocampus dactyliophorus]
MATSSRRQSAPPTPSKLSTETKPQTADNDVQQLISRPEERPPHPQEDPQPPNVKDEEEDLWTTQEGECLPGREEADLTDVPPTGVSVKTEDHEYKPPESLRCLCPSDVQQMVGPQLQGVSSTLKQEDPQPPHIKDEEEELWTTQEGECLPGREEPDLTEVPPTGVSVKTEDHEDKPPESSQLRHSHSEENRGAEPPSSSSPPQQMKTESDGDHCGGSQGDNLLAPLSDSDDTTSHSPDEEEASSSDTDGEGDRRTHADNKHSGCSKKKTALSSPRQSGTANA